MHDKVWDKKYLQRLASVYLDYYDTQGYEVAKKWYDGFLTPGLRAAIKPFVAAEVSKRASSGNNNNNKGS